MIKKYSEEKRLEVIDARKGGATIAQIATQPEVWRTTVKAWLKNAGLTARRKWESDEIQTILQEYEKCHSPKAVQEKYGICKSALYRLYKKRNTILTRDSEKTSQANEMSDFTSKMERKRSETTSQARLLKFGEDVPASLHYAVARKKRLRLLSEVAPDGTVKWSLACHGVARKGVDGRLRWPFFCKKKWSTNFA